MSNAPGQPINIAAMQARLAALSQGASVSADDLAAVTQDIYEAHQAGLASSKKAKARESLTPAGSSDRPLSREALSALASYGISGPRTYGEAFAHLKDTANTLGYPNAPTKRTTSTELTNEAERVNARLAGKSQSPKLSGEDAALLDQAHHLHILTKGMAVHSVSRGSTIQPQHTNFTPSGEFSKDVKERTRPDFTPRSGRPLINLPAVPGPMTGGTPGQRRYQQGQYNKTIKERHALMADLHTQHTARVTGAIEAREAPINAGLMWSYDPDDGGWAHRPNTPPVGQAPSSTPEAPTSNGPVNMRDVVSTAVGIIAKEEDLAARKLEARAKYPEQDNPVF